MGPSVATTSAFAASGAAWLTGFGVYNRGTDPWPFVLFVGGYVALGSLLLGYRSDRLDSTLIGLWLGTVGLVALLIVLAEPSWVQLVIGLVFSMVYTSVGFAAWVAIGLIALRLLKHLPDPAPAAHGH